MTGLTKASPGSTSTATATRTTSSIPMPAAAAFPRGGSIYPDVANNGDNTVDLGAFEAHAVYSQHGADDHKVATASAPELQTLADRC